ncbi:hypothetical protein SNK04_014315 [Fusarium graminearum]
MLGNDATWCGNSSTLFGACYVGTGSTAPAVGDTALAASPPARRGPVRPPSTSPRTAATTTWGSASCTGSIRRRHRQPVELGTGTSTNLFSRALIRDPITGNPVTITKLPDEFMDVTFELRVYVSASDTTGTVTISGVTYDTVTRICDINSPNMWAVDFRMTTRGIVAAGPSYFVGAQANQCAVYAGTLGAVTGRPSGANVSIPDNSSTVLTTPAAYVTGSFERKATFTLGLSDGNVAGGIRSIVYRSGLGFWQTQFTPPFRRQRQMCGPRTRYRPGDACRDPRFRLFIQRDRCRLALSDAGPIQAAGELHARHHGAGLPVLGGGWLSVVPSRGQPARAGAAAARSHPDIGLLRPERQAPRGLQHCGIVLLPVVRLAGRRNGHHRVRGRARCPVHPR